MNGRPPACAVPYPNGEDTEEQEEAGHSKAHLVDSGVSHQSLAVFPCVHLLTQVAVEGDLMGQTRDQERRRKVPGLDQCGLGQRPTSACVCIVKRPSSVYSLCHGSKGAERENRQQQQMCRLSVEPSFIFGSLQPVRASLKLTDSVQKQRPKNE